MTELEKAAREFQENKYPIWTGKGMAVGFHDAFVSGSEWQAKQSPWIRTEEQLPEDNELVLTSSGIYGTKLLVWNDHYKVWDDEDGDDVYCDRDKIDAWMPIPE